jgi:hypothetical protein
VATRDLGSAVEIRVRDNASRPRSETNCPSFLSPPSRLAKAPSCVSELVCPRPDDPGKSDRQPMRIDIEISREVAVYSACDSQHSLQIHLKPNSKDLRQSLKMC